MRTKVGIYFESKVRMEKVTENGMTAKFNELYVVDALSFSECEKKVVGYVRQYASGEFDVMTETRAKYREIFFSDDESEKIFYKAQLSFITLDERSGKEKKSKNLYLVQGSDIESAKKNIDEVMKGTMVDYTIEGLHETVIEDYIA